MISDDFVFVLDASAIIQIKQDVHVTHQWGLFRHLEIKFQSGEIAFPPQISAELRRAPHPDAPGVWACGMEMLRPKGFDVVQFEVYLEQVMSIAPDVIDPKKGDDEEDADPYVLALALEQRSLGREVKVVTIDRNDYADHIALTTACDRLGIGHLSLEESWALSIGNPRIHGCPTRPGRRRRR